MKNNYVSLNVNPCNMCMPMGVVTAMYGIKGCMTILHGSQGCSTYIRRHMATHYNEPIDISSSSLTEEGTVYGGEKNLLKGLDNLIELYHPEVIAIATTCLAETIGEDIKAISKTFYSNHPMSNVRLIPVPSPGYGGNQYDGYFKALRAIVENIEMTVEKNNKINIVTSPISPADTRKLKDILEDFKIDYILLPDSSENLDGGYSKEYSRLPKGGTTLEELSLMAGAKATIELSTFVKEDDSVGGYLEESYGVKNYRVNMPRGLKSIDEFLNLLAMLSDKEIPEKYKKQRDRYIDGMIDAHKYVGEARVAIVGEPDLVYSITNLALECGAIPVVVATGNKCGKLRALSEGRIKEVAKKQLVSKIEILDDTDYKTIESKILECNANVIIGSSDARRIEEKHNIPLIRVGFPIHDRVGGQRKMTIGYEGSMELFESIANAMLSKKETTFREKLYAEHYKEEKKPLSQSIKTTKEISIEEKTDTHPCFSCDASHKYARIHLPIAPKCNISCNYCLRKYDCPNESRPGVTTEVLSPKDAFEKYKLVKEKLPNLKVVGIAGPGDALANFEDVKESLSLIKEYDNEVTFCLSTNGLMLPFYADALVNFGVSHVTITINAVNSNIGAKVYKYVDYLGQRYTGKEAAEILLKNQLSGLKFLADKGIVCKVNIVMLKGINEDHIEEVVKTVKELGAKITNIMQMIPVKGSVFQDMPLVSNKEIMELRKRCGEHLKQMYHCKQCRADAIGLLGDDISLKFRKKEKEDSIVENIKGIKFAVASKSGMLVDKHFGHAEEFYIYEYIEGNVRFITKRNVEKYCNGIEECDDTSSKVDKIIKCIEDCKGVLCLRIGDAPRKAIEEKGIEIIITYDRVEDAVKKAAEAITVTV